jgi:hypothetical protein
MSTKRKTLKQKKLKDVRSSNIPQDIPNSAEIPSYSLDTTTSVPRAISTLGTQQFTFNLSEIKYSLIISTGLIIINSVLYILIKNSIINVDILGL